MDLYSHKSLNRIIHLYLEITRIPVVKRLTTFWVSFNQLCNLWPFVGQRLNNLQQKQTSSTTMKIPNYQLSTSKSPMRS
jgi:hypothetical protein